MLWYVQFFGFMLYCYHSKHRRVANVEKGRILMENDKQVKMEDIVSLAKRRGFIYQGSDVYGGLAGTWDYGPLGVTLKRNIMGLWWKMFVDSREDMFGIDAAILMNQKVWQASGHVDTFVDPLCEDTVNHKRYRTDHILKDNGVSADGLTMTQMDEKIIELGIKSPDGNPLGKSRTFNMMFRTFVGAMQGDEVQIGEPLNENAATQAKNNNIEGMRAVTYAPSSVSYLRPETAQGIFTNYKNVLDSFYPDLPFGLAQQGKAFRNEIAPRDFVFRSREFEQMEIEWFIDPENWEEEFEKWVALAHEWCNALGLPSEKVHELEVPAEDRAHYSKRTIDFEFDYPIGREEMFGMAYRTDFDLMNIQNKSGKSMEYTIKGTNRRFIPHVIEPSFGVERALVAVLATAYHEDEINGETRVYMKFPENLAPVRYCVSPLLKNKPELVAKAREVYAALKGKYGNVMWDDNGNIGKRYRRQDEIGTPYCVVIDFQTLEDDTVTVRDRDTTEQKRVAISDLA